MEELANALENFDKEHISYTVEEQKKNLEELSHYKSLYSSAQLLQESLELQIGEQHELNQNFSEQVSLLVSNIDRLEFELLNKHSSIEDLKRQLYFETSELKGNIKTLEAKIEQEASSKRKAQETNRATLKELLRLSQISTEAFCKFEEEAKSLINQNQDLEDQKRYWKQEAQNTPIQQLEQLLREKEVCIRNLEKQVAELRSIPPQPELSNTTQLIKENQKLKQEAQYYLGQYQRIEEQLKQLVTQVEIRVPTYIKRSKDFDCLLRKYNQLSSATNQQASTELRELRSEVTRERVNCKQLEKKMTEMAKELHDVLTENHKILLKETPPDVTTFSKYFQENTEMKLHIEELQQELLTAAETNLQTTSELTSQIDRLQEENNLLHSRLEVAHSSNSLLSTSQLELHKNSLEKTNQSLKNSLKELKNQLKTQQEENLSLETQVNLKTQELQKVRNEYSQLKTGFQKLEADNKAVNEKFTRLQNSQLPKETTVQLNFPKCTNPDNKIYKSLKETESLLTKTNKEHSEEVALLKSRIEELENRTIPPCERSAELVGYERKNSELRKLLDQCQEELYEEQTRRIEAQEKLTPKKSKEFQTQTDLSILQIEELEEQVQNFENKNKVLLRQNEKLLTTHQGTKTQLEETKQNNQALQNEFSKAMETMQKRRDSELSLDGVSELSVLRSICRGYLEEIHQLRLEINYLSNQHKSDLDTLQSRISHLQGELEAQKLQLKKLVRMLHHLTKR